MSNDLTSQPPSALVSLIRKENTARRRLQGHRGRARSTQMAIEHHLNNAFRAGRILWDQGHQGLADALVHENHLLTRIHDARLEGDEVPAQVKADLTTVRATIRKELAR